MNDENPFPNERLTYKLDVLAQAAIAANDAIFVRETGFRIRELRVLRLVDDTPGTTFAAIAKATSLERSLTSRIIQKLLGAGLVERKNSTEDARVFMLFTTDEGRRIRRIARGISDRLEEILTQPLDEAELRQLERTLMRLGGWVNSDAYAAALARRDAGDGPEGDTASTA